MVLCVCRYEVAVRDRITGNPLGGPPVHLTLLPADLNPRMSSFHIRGWEVTGGRPTVSAGADMQLTLAIYDIFGNAGRVREENIVAHASGVAYLPFSFCALFPCCLLLLWLMVSIADPGTTCSACS